MTHILTPNLYGGPVWGCDSAHSRTCASQISPRITVTSLPLGRELPIPHTAEPQKAIPPFLCVYLQEK